MKLRYVTLVIVLMVGMLWLIRPTPEDIAKCQDATGWTAERCQWELTR